MFWVNAEVCFSLLIQKELSEGKASGVNERILSTLLNEMDGIESSGNVLVVGATNRPWMLDDALLRPGRLDAHVLVDLPNLSDRMEIFKTLIAQGVSIREQDLEEIARASQDCSCADLLGWIRESAYKMSRMNSTENLVFGPLKKPKTRDERFLNF